MRNTSSTIRPFHWMFTGVLMTLLASFVISEANQSVDKAIVELRSEDMQSTFDSETRYIPLAVLSSIHLAGTQFTLSFDADQLILMQPELTTRSAHMTVASVVDEGEMTILLYSAEGKQISPGSDPILNIPYSFKEKDEGTSEIHMKEVILANPDAQSIPAAVRSTTVSVGIQTPTQYSLAQNYPNPFNPETAIEYQLPKKGHVSLVVYNVLGQEIRRLVDGFQDAGSYRAMWDGRDSKGYLVSGGVYFFHIKAGQYTEVRKMVLLK